MIVRSTEELSSNQDALVRDVVIRLSFCLFPLALTPLWGYLIADGYLNFGGGEKDLLLLIPWILWSLLYLVIFVITLFQRLPMKRGLVYSTVGATVVLVLLWLAMFVWSINGITTTGM